MRIPITTCPPPLFQEEEGGGGGARTAGEDDEDVPHEVQTVEVAVVVLVVEAKVVKAMAATDKLIGVWSWCCWYCVLCFWVLLSPAAVPVRKMLAHSQ